MFTSTNKKPVVEGDGFYPSDTPCATLTIQQKINGVSVTKPTTLTFCIGDAYDIYYDMVASGVDAAGITAFVIEYITPAMVSFKRLLNPFSGNVYNINLGESIEQDFGRFGTYTISLTHLGTLAEVR